MVRPFQVDNVDFLSFDVIFLSGTAQQEAGLAGGKRR
jgi:hypothetical protein